MTEDTFIKLYKGRTPKPKDTKIGAGLVETKKKNKSGVIELNHGTSGKRGCVTGADAYGPYAGSADACCGDGACACDGGACGESISPKTFVACLESLSSEYPESPVVGQIMNMFKAMQAGGNGKLYAAVDGFQSDSQPEEIENKCSSDADEVISAAAATCAAALETFRAVAGYDYFDYNQKRG